MIKVSVQEAAATIHEMVRRSGIRLTARSGDWCSIVSRNTVWFETGMAMHFAFEEEAWGIEAGIVVQQSAKQPCLVKTSWSSTGHTAHRARACIALYTRVVDLACLIQAYLDEADIEFDWKKPSRKKGANA